LSKMVGTCFVGIQKILVSSISGRVL
jgi:hypothetical protein